MDIKKLITDTESSLKEIEKYVYNYIKIAGPAQAAKRTDTRTAFMSDYLHGRKKFSAGYMLSIAKKLFNT